MANELTRRILHDGTKRAIVMAYVRYNDTNDGRVLLVDASALTTGRISTNLQIEKIQYSTGGEDNEVTVMLDWDAGTDVPFLTLAGNGTLDFEEKNLTNNSTTGKTGDIYGTSNGIDAAGSGYTIIFHLIKN